MTQFQIGNETWKSKRDFDRQMNKDMMEIWKGYGEVVIVDYSTGKRMHLKVDEIDDIPCSKEDKSDYYNWGESCYGCNGYKRMRKVEDVFSVEELK